MSSPSVPQFPLFGLPYLGIRNVIDCWNPFELCNFYMISKKTKEIAMKKGKKQSAVIEFGSYRALEIILQLNKNQKYQWTFHDVDNSAKTYEEVFHNQNVSVYCTEKVSVMLKLFNTFMELFNCSFGTIKFFSEVITDKKFESVINWFNTNYQKFLPDVYVASLQETFNMVFIQNFQGKIGKLRVADDINNKKTRMPMRFEVNKNLEIEDFELICGMPLDLSCLLSLNSVEVRGGTNLTNEELRTFLMSWQSGKTNSKLGFCCFSTPNKLNWKTILRGLSPVLRDIRTTKRAYWLRNTSRPQAHWIHGGVDIQRNDGKILTIADCGGGITNEENEEISKNAIDQFETVQTWDWNDDEENEEQGNVGGREECWFSFYVW